MARAAAAPAWQREELDQAEQPRHGEGRPGGTAFAWPGAEHDEANPGCVRFAKSR
jgi:hypothetical protein